jgi:hypothetical protein
LFVYSTNYSQNNKKNINLKLQEYYTNSNDRSFFYEEDNQVRMFTVADLIDNLEQIKASFKEKMYSNSQYYRYYFDTIDRIKKLKKRNKLKSISNIQIKSSPSYINFTPIKPNDLVFNNLFYILKFKRNVGKIDHQFVARRKKWIREKKELENIKEEIVDEKDLLEEQYAKLEAEIIDLEIKQRAQEKEIIDIERKIIKSEIALSKLEIERKTNSKEANQEFKNIYNTLVAAGYNSDKLPSVFSIENLKKLVDLLKEHNKNRN